MDLHARKPLERRGRDEIVVADADDGRIRVEAAKDRIANDAAHHARAASGSRTSVQRITRADQIEHAQADEERRVADRRDERADDQREHQHAAVAAGAGHARHGGDLVPLEQIGRHRDHRHRERLVREAAQAQQRDRRVRVVDEPDEGHAHHQHGADGKGAAARVDQAEPARASAATG